MNEMRGRQRHAEQKCVYERVYGNLITIIIIEERVLPKMVVVSLAGSLVNWIPPPINDKKWHIVSPTFAVCFIGSFLPICIFCIIFTRHLLDEWAADDRMKKVELCWYKYEH